jgi:hypothetical protein
MTDVVLKGLFFQNARGMRIADSASITWTFDSTTNTLTGESAGGPGGSTDDDEYTPGLTNVANLDGSTAYVCQWLQVGDRVHVAGKVSVDPTTPGVSTRLGIALPVASNIGAEEDCGGVAFAPGVAGGGAAIKGDAANNRAELIFVANFATNQDMFFSFSYKVI